MTARVYAGQHPVRSRSRSRASLDDLTSTETPERPPSRASSMFGGSGGRAASRGGRYSDAGDEGSAARFGGGRSRSKSRTRAQSRSRAEGDRMGRGDYLGEDEGRQHGRSGSRPRGNLHRLESRARQSGGGASKHSVSGCNRSVCSMPASPRHVKETYNNHRRSSSNWSQAGRGNPPPPPPKRKSGIATEVVPLKNNGTSRRRTRNSLGGSGSGHSLESQDTEATYPSTEHHSSNESDPSSHRKVRSSNSYDGMEEYALTEYAPRHEPPRDPPRSRSGTKRGQEGERHSSRHSGRYNSRERGEHRSESRGSSRRYERATSRGRYSREGRSSSRVGSRPSSRDRFGGRSQSRSRMSSGAEDRNYRQVAEYRGSQDPPTGSSSKNKGRSRSRPRQSTRSTSPADVSSRASNSRSDPRRRSASRSRARPQEPQDSHPSNHSNNQVHDDSSHLLTHPQQDSSPPDDNPPGNEINLVIDSEGHGTFHIATKGLAGAASKKSQTHLTFDVHIDESSQRYLIHTSMGRLDKIREIHPGMNILRTLSYWNGLQKRRYGMNPAEIVRGGQLGIVAKNRTNLVMMTLMGEYSHRAWEYDDVFQRELERFVEDALQFHLCLNGDRNGGGTSDSGSSEGAAPSGASGGRRPSRVVPRAALPSLSKGRSVSIGMSSNGEPSPANGGGAEEEKSANGGGRRKSKLLGKVFKR